MEVGWPQKSWDLINPNQFTWSLSCLGNLISLSRGWNIHPKNIRKFDFNFLYEDEYFAKKKLLFFLQKVPKKAPVELIANFLKINQYINNYWKCQKRLQVNQLTNKQIMQINDDQMHDSWWSNAWFLKIKCMTRERAREILRMAYHSLTR